MLWKDDARTPIKDIRKRFQWLSGHIKAWIAAVCAILLAMIPLLTSGADIWYQISVDPEYPRANKRVAVQVQSSVQVDQQCLDEINFTPEPVEVALFQRDRDTMEVRAIGPDGQRHHCDMHKSADDPTVWNGDTAFPEPGEWSILLITIRSETTRLPVPDTCTGTATLLTVLAAEGTPGATPVATPTTANM